MIEKKYFNGLLNADDAPEFLGENEYVNAVNIRFGSSDGGKTGWIENINSNTLIANTLPSGTNTCIGSCVDEDEQTIIFFIKNVPLSGSALHGIYAYLNTGVVKKVLTSDQVEGGLNFSNLIQTGIINDQLFWVDGVNEFRRINYKAGIKSNDSTYSYTYAYPSGQNAIKQSLITAIRRPPQYALEIDKVADNTVVTNFIKDECFKFSYFYTYRDGEQSVLAPWSVLGRYNFDTDTSSGKNAYDLKVSFSEEIDYDVQKVSFVFKNEASGKVFIVKEWNKNVTTENTSISNHNSKSSKLSFRFYNNQNGIAIDDAFSVKLYDNIPLSPKAYEAAKNRSFLGNYLQGYDSPVYTSLSASVSAAVTSGSITGIWYILSYIERDNNNFIVSSLTKHLIFISGIALPGYYEYTPGPPYPSPTIDYQTQLNGASGYKGNTAIEVFNSYNIVLDPNNTISFSPEGTTTTITNVSLVTTGNKIIVKSDASYALGIVFYDFARRKCGVVTNDACRVNTPDRTRDSINDRSGINWSIPSNLTQAELQQQIPAWATHYTIVSTKCLRTDYFLQIATSAVNYVSKKTDGSVDYTTPSSTYTDSKAGISVNIENLLSSNLGYVYTDGDICKIYTSSGIYSLPIIQQEGNFILCQNKDIGALGITNAKIEIFTLKKQNTSEFYYEQGSIYSILNAGASNRTFSVFGGTIQGDVCVVQRGTGANAYTVEAMSSNDKFYKNWYTNAGSPNLVTTLGQQKKINGITYSNKYIPGTNTNGLCTFDALDESEVPQECGGINKLILTSKTQDDGTVMLAICKYETASIYLGESQLVSNQGNSFIAKSDGVVGTVNILKGSFGTMHPESVCQYAGLVYWFDAFNGKVIQYSSNGLFPISEYKMSTVFNQIGKKYIGQTANFFGGFDPFHQEYLLTSSFTTGSPSYGNFSTTSLANRLNAYEAYSFTYAFKSGGDKWVGKYDFIPENMVYLGNKLYTFKGGKLYEHGGSGYNNFYGIQYSSILSFVSNVGPSALKVYSNIAIEGNRKPDYVVAYNAKPNVQVTTLESGDFEEKEGIYYAPIYRDRLSPNVLGSSDLKMIKGDKMRGTSMYFQLIFSGSSKLELRFVDINFNVSTGHNINTVTK